MNKNTAKYIVDIGLFISTLIVIITGIIKFRSFLGIFGITPDYSLMNTGLLRSFHDWSGIAMTLFVIIHLILNWDWIVSITKTIFSRKKE